MNAGFALIGACCALTRPCFAGLVNGHDTLLGLIHSAAPNQLGAADISALNTIGPYLLMILVTLIVAPRIARRQAISRRRSTIVFDGFGPTIAPTPKGVDFERRAFADLLNQSKTAIITIDDDDIIQAINNRAASLFGYTPEEVVGRHVDLLMPKSPDEVLSGRMIHYLTDERKAMLQFGPEYVGRRRNGERFPLELIVREIWTERGAYLTAVVRELRPSSR